MPSLLHKYGTLLIFALGLCLYLTHLQHSNISGFTPFVYKGGGINFYMNDAYSHLEYVQHSANTLTIPDPRGCWECHQPPLYYILAAYPYSIAQDFNLMPPVLAARLLSLVFYFVFLFFGARLLAMEVSSIPIYYVALSLLVFWPLSATRATLLSNDIPLYMAEAAAFYYIMRWRRDEIPANLALAILWNGIAIAFKYSGIIITPFLGYIFVIQCYKNRACIRQLLTKPVLICLCASLLLVVGTFARTYYHYRIANTISLPLIAPTMMLLPRNLIIQNHLLDFVIPHFNSYLTSPFLQNYGAPLEHHYFINYVVLIEVQVQEHLPHRHHLQDLIRH